MTIFDIIYKGEMCKKSYIEWWEKEKCKIDFLKIVRLYRNLTQN